MRICTLDASCLVNEILKCIAVPWVHEYKGVDTIMGTLNATLSESGQKQSYTESSLWNVLLPSCPGWHMEMRNMSSCHFFDGKVLFRYLVNLPKQMCLAGELKKISTMACSVVKQSAVCVCACVCMWVCLWLCVCVCVCVCFCNL